MRKICFLLVILCLSIVTAQEQDIYDNCEIYGNCITLPTFNNNTAFVNSSGNWITPSLGVLSDANATQFDNNGGTLSVDTTWLNSFGNGLWCALTGCTMGGDINMNSNAIYSATYVSAGSSYTGLIGDDGNSRGGYFTSGGNSVALANDDWAINALGSFLLSGEIKDGSEMAYPKIISNSALWDGLDFESLHMRDRQTVETDGFTPNYNWATPGLAEFFSNNITTLTAIRGGSIIGGNLNANEGVYADGDGKLVSTIPSSGDLGFWNRAGNVLSPANDGDDIETAGFVNASYSIADNFQMQTPAPEYTANVLSSGPYSTGFQSVLPLMMGLWGDGIIFKPISSLEFYNYTTDAWQTWVGETGEELIDGNSDTEFIADVNHTTFRITIASNTFIYAGLNFIEQDWDNAEGQGVNGAKGFNFTVETDSTSAFSSPHLAGSVVYDTFDSGSKNRMLFVNEHTGDAYWRFTFNASEEVDEQGEALRIVNLKLLTSGNLGRSQFRGVPVSYAYDKTATFEHDIVSGNDFISNGANLQLVRTDDGNAKVTLEQSISGGVNRAWLSTPDNSVWGFADGGNFGNKLFPTKPLDITGDSLIDGDENVTGFSTFQTPLGGFWSDDAITGPLTAAFPSANVLMNFTDLNSSSIIVGNNTHIVVNISGGTINFTEAAIGIYQVYMGGSFESNKVGTFHCAVYKNYIDKQEISFQRRISTVNQVGDAGKSGYVNISNAGDFLNIQCETDSGAGPVATVNHFNFNVERTSI